MTVELEEKEENVPRCAVGSVNLEHQIARWATHGMVTTANKSVRMNYHWVQEAVRDGFIDMRRVPTADNTSDVFTKTLGETDILRLRPGLTGS